MGKIDINTDLNKKLLDLEKWKYIAEDLEGLMFKNEIELLKPTIEEIIEVLFIMFFNVTIFYCLFINVLE